MSPSLFILLVLACSGTSKDQDLQQDSVATDSVSGSETGGDDTDSGPTDTAAAAAAFLQFDGEAPHNVLMISIDTLRRDSLGYYAGEDRDTPTFDRLLTDGVSLDKHRSCSNWTYASVLCALSGQYNMDFGLYPENGAGAGTDPIQVDDVMLSTHLRDKGYATALASANPFLGVGYGFAAHFDRLNDATDTSAPTDGESLIAQSMESFDVFDASGDPWLIHLHFLEPHAPYNPPAEYIDGASTALGFSLKSGSGVNEAANAYGSMSQADQDEMKRYADRMYRAEVQNMDVILAQLLAEMEAAGALEDTLVVLWTDHGEQLWDRDALEHGYDLHSEESDAIALYWANNIIPASVTLPTTHRDITPTTSQALGLRFPGENIGRVVGTDVLEEPTFAGRLRSDLTLQSVDLNGRRMVYNWNGDVSYHNLETDPDELDDLFDPTDPIQYELWELLLPEIERLSDFYDDPAEPLMPDWNVK